MFKKVVVFICTLAIIISANSAVFAADHDYTRVYNVKSAIYKAQGDGTTDDTAAIQSALDDVHTAGGGIVYFPEGNYKTSKNLNVYSNTTVRGNQSSRIFKIDIAENPTTGWTVLNIQPIRVIL